MVSQELITEISDAVGQANAKLREALSKRGVQVVTTNYGHCADYDPSKIDGTQSKGMICTLPAVDPAVPTKRALHAMLVSVYLDVTSCQGPGIEGPANCYLLNYFNVEFTERDGRTQSRIVLRGCPSLAPAGFDFARASAELTADLEALSMAGPQPYGYDLRCHPAFVKDCAIDPEQ